MIKYLGSKRRLVPALSTLAAASCARTALDLFTGTTRVAQAFKQLGLHVTAVDSAAYAATFARCYVETDRSNTDAALIADALMELSLADPVEGYVTRTFADQAHFFRRDNAMRIDAARRHIALHHAGTPLEPILITAVIEAADRIDSTTGVQMAFLKSLAPRAFAELTLRSPELHDGTGRAVHGDAVDLVGSLGSFDLAYLDPPYNQHRYKSNYHVWETLALGDEPDHFGKVCKRDDLRDASTRSAFDSRRTMPDALAHCITRVDAATVVVSMNDESWVTLDDVVAMCGERGAVEVIPFPTRRYVGAMIGIHNPTGQRVGTVGRLHNVEYLIVAGEIRPELRAAITSLRHTSATTTRTAVSESR
ncbi:MAG: DNA adenine methylase [Acidimicrobiia bacterium]